MGKLRVSNCYVNKRTYSIRKNGVRSQVTNSILIATVARFKCI